MSELKSMIIKVIEAEEGWKSTPYRCSEGYPTVGYGFKVGHKNGEIPYFILPKAAGDAWLLEIIRNIESKLNTQFWYSPLCPARKVIVISMIYQMGYHGVRKFKNMIKALENKNYNKAAEELMDSTWAKQTPNRAKRHYKQMQTGKLHSYYA